MSEWPEALVEKVAEAMGAGWVEMGEFDERVAAVAALDALGLREEVESTSWVTERRFVTDWEDV